MSETDKATKEEIQLRMMRTCKMLLCHDYLEELSGQIGLDTLRLELLHETNQMRMRAYLMPRDSRIHVINPARHGEHQWAAYAEENDEDIIQTPFYDEDHNKIKNFFQIPSFKEIMALDPNYDKFAQLNLQKLFQFDIFNPLAGIDEAQLPSLLQNNHIDLIKPKLPKLTTIDIKEADTAIKERLRFVDYREAFNVKGNLQMKMLYYFRNLQNLFDLEFFMNKLPSKTRGIAGLEHNVMCGLPFWEEADDAMFGDDDDDYLTTKDINNP